jgi:hypothetical protein
MSCAFRWVVAAATTPRRGACSAKGHARQFHAWRPCTVELGPRRRRGRDFDRSDRRADLLKNTPGQETFPAVPGCPSTAQKVRAQEAIMGLLDQVLGGADPSSGGRGMSPINVALLGLLAWLMQQTGMSREDLLSGLSRELPKVVPARSPRLLVRRFGDQYRPLKVFAREC